MRLVSYLHGSAGGFTETFGAVVSTAAGDGIVALGARLGGDPLIHLLGRDAAFDAMREIVARCTADVALADVRLLKPVPEPRKIVCVGVNYADRNEEYRDGSERPRYPSLFMRTPESLVAHGDPLWRPPESEQLDYEGEIGLIIGRGGRRIAEAEAMAHVAGLTIVNEGTVRDWIRHGKFNVTQGKNFAASGAVGPWLVTLDECPPGPELHLVTRVNGEVRQDDVAARMMFPFPRLIAYLSTFMTLQPGDLIATGTPTGAGARFDPPRWLRPGDVVDVTVSGVGTLVNTVIDEPR